MANTNKTEGSINNLLDCMEIAIKLSKNSGMSTELLKNAYIMRLAFRMKVTVKQAVLFSLCMHYGPLNTLLSEIADHLGISKVSVLRYSDDLDTLVKRKLLRYNDSDGMSYDVPLAVINEVKHNKVFSPPPSKGLDVFELFNRLRSFFYDLENSPVTAETVSQEVKELFDDNPQLEFVKKVRKLKLIETDFLMFILFCHLCVNNDDNCIVPGDFEDLFENRSHFNRIRRVMMNGSHPLFTLHLVEHVCEGGQVNPGHFKLTDAAKDEFLSEFNMNMNKVEEKVAGMIYPDTLKVKPMFYTASLERQVEELTSFLDNEEYLKICGRMKEKGFHSGLTCLFYGPPGTGKTETVYQVARKTGRGILMVDVPQIKSKWVGDSEKNVKAIFMQYRRLVEKMKLAPVLLFNEADAIIGSRKMGAESAVDKMENAIQNIILQEMENMEGILIATTNLEGNLDPAFERRFLYKVQFERPDVCVRKHIWHAMVPQLAPADLTCLAQEYTFSGAQIENVARKLTVFEILHGQPDNYVSMLRTYCNEEGLKKNVNRRCGFV